MGKKILVTGAGTGIGACIARLFGSYGADVGVHYNRSENEAREVQKDINGSGGQSILLKADLLNDDERSRLVPSFVQEFGKIDVLVNNAGAAIGHQHFSRMDLDSWEKTLKIGLTSPFFLARDSFMFMKENDGGRIINITSIASKYGGSPSTIHYGAAKSGLDAVTKTLAREGAPYNILVNSVMLGVVDTAFHKKIGRDSLEERIKKIPLQRPGKPIDAARMCLYLASEGGDYITGQTLGITGGD